MPFISVAPVGKDNCLGRLNPITAVRSSAGNEGYLVAGYSCGKAIAFSNAAIPCRGFGFTNWMAE
jgi:hypothetical protein